MVKYILTTFHTHDEEIETVHLPVVFAAILELLAVSNGELPYMIPSSLRFSSHVLETTHRTRPLL